MNKPELNYTNGKNGGAKCPVFKKVSVAEEYRNECLQRFDAAKKWIRRITSDSDLEAVGETRKGLEGIVRELNKLVDSERKPYLLVNGQIKSAVEGLVATAELLIEGCKMQEAAYRSMVVQGAKSQQEMHLEEAAHYEKTGEVALAIQHRQEAKELVIKPQPGLKTEQQHFDGAEVIDQIAAAKLPARFGEYVPNDHEIGIWIREQKKLGKTVDAWSLKGLKLIFSTKVGFYK